MKHKHIPFGNGHITMIGDAEPTQEMIEAFEKIKELALILPKVNRSLPTNKEITSELVTYFKKLQKNNPTLIVDLYLEAYKLGFNKVQKPSDNG